MLRAVSTSRQPVLATRSFLTRTYSTTSATHYESKKGPRIRLKSDSSASSSSNVWKGNRRDSLDSKTPRRDRASSSVRANGPEFRRKLLTPYNLASKLRAICSEGDLNRAVELLQNAPHDAQNIQVWNTLVQQAMQKQRYSLAYSLAQQAKKRGFQWSIPTYLTLYSGWSQISDWKGHSIQLENCNATYEQFKEFVDHLRDTNAATDGRPESHVRSIYIKILSSAQQWQKIFDVYNDCEETGPFAANEIIYTAILQALAGRPMTEKTTEMSIDAQNASDAKLIWRQLMVSHAKNNTPIDGHVIRAVLNALSQGRASDHLFGFDIIKEHLGLTRPGESPHKVSPYLSPQALQSVLRLCQNARKHRLSIHYIGQVMQYKPEIVDARHMSQLMIAHSELAASGSPTESIDALESFRWFLKQNVLQPPQKRNPPPGSLYSLVVAICWRCADWNSAMEVFDLLTGYKAAEFTDEGNATITTLTREDRSRGYNIVPDALALSFWARAALATEHKANMRQCLRIIDHLGLREALAQGSALPSDGNRYTAFHVHKLASAVMEMVDKVLPDTPDKATKGKWLWMRSVAQSYLKDHHRGPIPLSYEHRISSQLGQEDLERMDAEVDLAMVNRQSKPRIPSKS